MAPDALRPGTEHGGSRAVVVVVDVANVMGSRPDGWWRDRAGAAGRLITRLARLTGSTVDVPDLGPLRVGDVVAVLEGQARAAARSEHPDGVTVVAAAGSGDNAVVEVVAGLVAAGHVPLVVTADRGLRARLPAAADVCGPRRLLDVLDALSEAAPDSDAG